jgi:hypothetical protein
MSWPSSVYPTTTTTTTTTLAVPCPPPTQADEAEDAVDDTIRAQDELELYGYITGDSRLRSFAFVGPRGSDGALRLALSTTDNQLLEYKLSAAEEVEVGHSVPSLLRAIALEVRAGR